MDREALRQRLIDAEIAEEVVDGLLSELKDDDLVRMKEMSIEQILKALQEALKEDDEEDEEDEDETEEGTSYKKEETPSRKSDSDDAEALANVLNALGENIEAKVKEALDSHTFEVEMPQIAEIQGDIQQLKEQIAAVSTVLKEVQEMWDQVFKSDEARLRGLVSNLSPAQRTRLRIGLTDNQMMERLNKEGTLTPAPGQPAPFRPGVRDSQGNEYANLSDMSEGIPIKR